MDGGDAFMEKHITMAMIAEKCGTSIGTVDRALNNRPGISPKTRQLVLDTARQLGYTPNRFAAALSRKKSIRVGMVYCRKPQDFYQDIENGIRKAGAELAGYAVQVESLQSPTLSPQDQRALLESADLRQYDALAINSAGGQTTVGTINTLRDDGIPVITFNTDAPHSRRLFYVGSSARQSGRMGAELMGKLVGGSGQIATLGNFASTAANEQRLDGFNAELQRITPAIRTIPLPPCEADARKAEAITAQAVFHTPHLDGIFCTSHTATVGAVRALERLRRRDIRLIGYDLGKHTVAALREGWCTALLYQDPFQQSYQAARLLARHLLEGWLPETPLLHIQTQVVLNASLDVDTGAMLADGLFF